MKYLFPQLVFSKRLCLMSLPIISAIAFYPTDKFESIFCDIILWGSIIAFFITRHKIIDNENESPITPIEQIIIFVLAIIALIAPKLVALGIIQYSPWYNFIVVIMMLALIIYFFTTHLKSKS